MASELDSLKARVNKMEHERMPAGLIIRGIEEQDDAMSAVMKIAKALEVEINNADNIIKAQWVRAKGS